MKHSAFLKLFALLFFTIQLAGCMFNGHYIDESRMISPEVPEKPYTASLSLIQFNNTELIVTDDATQNPPDFDSPKAFNATNTGDMADIFSLGFSVSPKIELFGKNRRIGAKYKLFGKPSRKGVDDFSFATAIFFENEKSTQDSSNEYSSEYSTNYYSTLKLLDLSAIFGYRVNKHILFYGGPFFSKINVKGHVIQHENDLTRRFDFSKSLSRHGLNAAVEFSCNFYLDFLLTGEVVYSKYSMQNLSGEDGFYYMWGITARY